MDVEILNQTNNFLWYEIFGVKKEKLEKLSNEILTILE